KFYPKLYVKLGEEGKNSVYINNNGTWEPFNHYEYFNVRKRQNQVSEFEIKIYDISTAEKAYFKEQAEVLFFAGKTLILKGRIQNIEYSSGYEVIARGFGMEAKLLDKEFIKNGENRIQYTNTSARTIVTEINDGILNLKDGDLALNLIGYWALDETSGSVLDSYNNYTGSALGGVTRGATGKIDNCFDFDGIDDAIQITSALDIEGNNRLTVAYWMQGTGGDHDYPDIIRNGGSGDTNFKCSYRTASNGAGTFYVESADKNLEVTGSTCLTDGNWHHCVGVFDQFDDSLKFYVDGILDGSTSGASGMALKNIGNDLRFGKHAGAFLQREYRGKLDEIGIWDCALTKAQISELYNSGDGLSYAGIFGADFGNISIRFEHANRLNAIGKVAEATDYKWWVSTDPKDYDIDILNFASDQGETSSQKTFDIGSTCIKTSQEKDINNVVNYVRALGYGDGINQLKTSVYAASTQSSFLNENIDSTQSTILVADASDFDSTGSARIAEEQITYAGISANTLTGCTRGVNSTTARAHNKNCYIEQHFASDSPQTGSSIQTYGLMDQTFIDKTIVNRETLEVIASGYLSDKKSPIIRIKIKPDEPLTDATLNIGDTVTVTDPEANISGDYRIVGLDYTSNYGVLDLEIEVSNRSLEFIEQMNKQREESESMAKYMQGSTNIYAINEAENCDENHPLNMRFYLPDDLVALNKVLLSFKLKDYRSYTSTSGSNSVKTIIAASGRESYINKTTTFGEWVNIGSISTPDEDCDGVYLYFSGHCMNSPGGDMAKVWYIRIYDGTNYYFDEYGISGLMGGNNLNGQIGCSFTFFIPGNQKNKTFTFQVMEALYNDGKTYTFDFEGGYEMISKHTHAMGYEINEETLSNPSVDISAGEEGSETSIGTYTSDQEDIDITDAVSKIGAGNWINIKFDPNKRMRIEANAYVKVFIEST
ncbi:MAG: LamG domain-containing protein, partial [Candidatus Helarchaeota archaeon]